MFRCSSTQDEHRDSSHRELATDASLSPLCNVLGWQVRWMSVSKDLSTLFTSACDHKLKIWRLEDFKLLRDCPDQVSLHLCIWIVWLCGYTQCRT